MIKPRPISEAKPGMKILAWGVSAGGYGYTENKYCWMQMEWAIGGRDVESRWVVRQPTGRYFNSFTPKYFIEIPDMKGKK